MDYCDGYSPDLGSFDRLHVSCNYYDFYWPSYYNKYVDEDIGVQTEHGNVYQTDMLATAATVFISEQLTKQQNDDPDAKPFIMWVAPYAPHTPAFPATEYQDEFDDIDLVRELNYNCDVDGYHLPLRDNPPITTVAEQTMLLLYKNRLRTLISVDDMVHDIVNTVSSFDGAWDNTYIIYARFVDVLWYIYCL